MNPCPRCSTELIVRTSPDLGGDGQTNSAYCPVCEGAPAEASRFIVYRWQQSSNWAIAAVEAVENLIAARDAAIREKALEEAATILARSIERRVDEEDRLYGLKDARTALNQIRALKAPPIEPPSRAKEESND